VRHDGHEGGEFVARVLVHKCCGSTQANTAARRFHSITRANSPIQTLFLIMQWPAAASN
jgi:hypothetical protein